MTDPTRDVEFVTAAEVQELTFVVPLLEQARARVGQVVTVHIPGGLAVEGTLASVGDDATLLIRDDRRQYDVALQSVAVLEGNRP